MNTRARFRVRLRTTKDPIIANEQSLSTSRQPSLEDESSKIVALLRRLAEGDSPCILSRWVFLRLLGLTYAIAFVSLLLQIDGLIGSRGILPISPFLQSVGERIGIERFVLLPTLCWINSSDSFLHFLCVTGTVLAFLLMIGWFPVPCLIGLWALYLSLVSASRVFLSYQWDALLIETGFLAIFLAPLSLRLDLSRHSPPSPIALWLLRWLLFRLMFSSGVVKLASGDPSWRDLTALTYHYETQPLPTWVGWYAHQLPAAFQKISALMMFIIELWIPFLILVPRLGRRIAFGAFLGLQILIGVTGNYCFFNLLAVALCFLLIDDTDWPAGWKKALPHVRPDPTLRPPRRWPREILLPLAACVLYLSSLVLFNAQKLPVPLLAPLRWAAPFRTVNHYGLFAVMTTSRPEIIVEGSNDGRSWRAYEFRWKPGDVGRRPAFVASYQPRLDWQMWFAAIGSYENNPWFMQFLGRLLQGSPDVLGLIRRNPFPDSPPRFIRGVVYDYHFTTIDERGRNGAWWRRKRMGLYCPTVSLRGDQ